MHSPLRFICIALCILCTINIASCQMGRPPISATPRKEDVKLILCDVCRSLSHALYTQSIALLAHSNNISGKKADESDMIDMVERSTTSWRDQGEWMTSLTLQVTSDSRLAVRDMKELGECGEACKTIEKASQEIMDGYDIEIAEALYMKKFKDLDSFQQWMCYDSLSKPCSAANMKQQTRVLKNHKPYPPFVARSPDDQNVEKIMGEMEDNGLRGKIWSREELMERYLSEMNGGEL